MVEHGEGTSNDAPPASPYPKPAGEPGGGPAPWPPFRRVGIPPVAEAILFLILVFFAYQVVGTILAMFLVGFDLTEANAPAMRTAIAVSQVLFLLGPAVLAPLLLRRDLRRVLRLRPARWKDLGLVVLMMIAIQFLAEGYMAAQQYILETYILPESLQPLLREFERLMQGMYAKLLVMNSPAELAAVWVVVALVPSVCEEAVFRGVAQSTFENGMQPGRAAVVTGLCFGVYHLYPTQLIPLTAIGIVLGVAVLRTGSIIPAVVGHLANNTFAVVGEYIHPTAGRQTALLADAGVAALTLSTAVGACLFALSMIVFIRGTRRFPPSPEKEI